MDDHKVLDVTENVKWIGVLDYDLVTFDVVMETEFGTTYNSYFIDAQKKTIIDNVKEKFWDTYHKKLLQVVDPAEIEYIIVNHTEPDHSGTLLKFLEVAPKAKIVGSGNAIRYLKDILQTDFPHMIVKDGYTLDLGDRTLHFIGAPNLHWPDTIYTYLAEEKILFTCDSFGCHFANEKMFDDLVGDFDESFLYYFDVILKPFSKFLLKAIDKIRNLEISVVCPGHGPILRSDWIKYVDLSERLAKEYLTLPKRKKVYIPFVSAYQKTRQLAELIAEGLRKAGDLDVELSDIEMVPVAEMEQKVAHATAIIVGSPTINQNILLPVYKLFSVISPIRDKGKLAGAFGSYGWSGESRKLLGATLENLKLEYFGEGVFVKFTPGEADKEAAIKYGYDFGITLLTRGDQPEQE